MVSGFPQTDVNRPLSQKTGWNLTAEAFAKLLACLDSNPEKAGEKYEAIRQTLVKFFDWRGAHFPEEYTDETLNRVARKIDEGETIQDVATYCHGVARLVFLEKLKSPDGRRADLDDAPELVAATPDIEEPDARQECFNRCLHALPTENQQILLQYYQDEKRTKINNRLTLAERLGIPLNALRSRVQRLRDKLEQCIEGCRQNNP